MSALQSPPPADHLAELIDRATAVDGQPPFSDQSLIELERGERSLIGSAHGVAILSGDELELVIDPSARRHGHGAALLEVVLDKQPALEFAWAHGDHPGSRALAARFGFEPVRTLLQLRALELGGKAISGLPGDASAEGRLGPRIPGLDTPASRALDQREITAAGVDQRGTDASGFDQRAFRPGTDDAAWLALNARAFAHHPEQGRLTQRDLDARMAEPWFDAEDFLLLWDDDRLLAFCWLKVEGAIGEFYAVGVDPNRQGEGLGRVLMDAGFSRLAERGIREAALYVEADNGPALALYRRYGFTRHTIDVRYSRQSG